MGKVKQLDIERMNDEMINHKTIGSLVYDEVMKQKLIEKQRDVLRAIDQRLDAIHQARKTSHFFIIGFGSDKESAEMYEKILAVRTLCASIDSFQTVELSKIKEIGIEVDEIRLPLSNIVE